MAASASQGSAAERPDGEEDKLHSLYWNRAELKKEFSKLERERFRLLDALKASEGETARLQQKLEYLEDLLSDPATAWTTLIHYQLRGVWTRSHRRLKQFGDELYRQCDVRERRAHLENWRRRQTEQRRTVERQLEEQRNRCERAEAAERIAAERIEEASLVKRVVGSKGLREALESRKSEAETLRANVRTLERRTRELDDEEAPTYRGIELSSRRAINFTVLAYGEFLYGHYARHGLAEMSRVATQRASGAVDYGGDEEAASLLERIKRAAAELERIRAAGDFTSRLKLRAGVLSQRARFERETETVPEAESVFDGAVIEDDPDPLFVGCDVNLLKTDFWHIRRALLY